MNEARLDGRSPGELREVRIEPGFMRTATGSALIEAGGTRVICTATVEERISPGETNVFEGDAGRWVAVRPERMRLLSSRSAVPSGFASRPGEIRDLVYLGVRLRYGGAGAAVVWIGLNLGSSAAQSVILMVIVIALTAIQFRYVERRVQY